ncbi:hypothetical protein VP06_04810 [Methylobacterium aquaticum]|uniref:Uncharacterized protein n=1 Tax=Methylobacterium aquaticum TaxID=270351 RepID=A0A0J6SV99_9HYPH|nr:hypothetical protein VP06_04810 [Methylobacterium aquaticum]
MIGSTVRKLLSPATWRSLWETLEAIEAALATTEAEIHDRRIARLEAEMAELRARIGPPPLAAQSRPVGPSCPL